MLTNFGAFNLVVPQDRSAVVTAGLVAAGDLGPRRTDLDLYNGADTPASCRLELLRRDLSNRDPLTATTWVSEAGEPRV